MQPAAERIHHGARARSRGWGGHPLLSVWSTYRRDLSGCHSFWVGSQHNINFESWEAQPPWTRSATFRVALARIHRSLCPTNHQPFCLISRWPSSLTSDLNVYSSFTTSVSLIELATSFLFQVSFKLLIDSLSKIIQNN